MYRGSTYKTSVERMGYTDLCVEHIHKGFTHPFEELIQIIWDWIIIKDKVHSGANAWSLHG